MSITGASVIFGWFHATFGIGYRAGSRLSLDLAYYRAFENEVSGPLLSPAGPIPGTTVTQSNESDSVVTTLGFSF